MQQLESNRHQSKLPHEVRPQLLFAEFRVWTAPDYHLHLPSTANRGSPREMLMSALLSKLFLVCCCIRSAFAQYDPVKDFCRRFGHQSAVVDSRLYVDGGLVNWKPFSETSQNLSSEFPLPLPLCSPPYS